jgi:hypothetical protein
MSAAEQIHYCRLPLPEDNEWGGKLLATKLAINEVLIIMERTGVDPTKGEFRVYYPVDSALIRTYVTAEWRPNK